MSKAKEEYYEHKKIKEVLRHVVEQTAWRYITELEQQNEEMLDKLLDIYKLQKLYLTESREPSLLVLMENIEVEALLKKYEALK